MKIQFNKELLNKTLSLFQRIAANKTSSNMPGSIYISTKEDYVELQANDFEIGIKSTVEATILEPGTLVVGSMYFQELLRKVPGETVELTRPEGTNTLQIKSDSAEFKLLTMNLEDFPLVEPLHSDNELLIDAKQLKELIDLTGFAASTDTDRPIFCGALVDGNHTNLTMVGTDTHRMAVKTIELENVMTNPIHIIIPKRTLDEMSKSLPLDVPTVVKLTWTRSQMALEFGNVYLISRLIEGNYPDYNRVIPALFDASAVTNRREFAGALDRVYFLARSFSYSAVRYDWHQKEVVLSTENAEMGRAQDTLLCDFDGEPFSISYNGKYMEDFLKHTTADRIHLYLKRGGAAVLKEDNNDSYTYVVTSVRV